MIAMTEDEAARYARDGYILRRGLLSAAEVAKFRDHAREQLERESRGGKVLAKGDKEGKTTLLKMILGTEQPDSGTIQWGKNTQAAYYDQKR